MIKRKWITPSIRLLILGLLATALLSLPSRPARQATAAAANPSPPAPRQKYVIQNILSNDNSTGNLARLRSDFLDAIENQYPDLDVEIENRDWLATEKCKAGQNCDLITIDVDRRQLLIRCTEKRKGLISIPVPPAPCPNSRERCMIPLAKQLPKKLWAHDEIHRNKKK
jgi:hypothetical protein